MSTDVDIALLSDSAIAAAFREVWERCTPVDYLNSEESPAWRDGHRHALDEIADLATPRVEPGVSVPELAEAVRQYVRCKAMAVHDPMQTGRVWPAPEVSISLMKARDTLNRLLGGNVV